VPDYFFYCNVLSGNIKIRTRGSRSAFQHLQDFFLGLAIIGRSPFLVVCLALTVLLSPDFSSTRNTINVIISCFIALAVALPVFLVWGGLVPPDVQQIEIGFAPFHVFSAFAYAGIFSMIIAPRFFLIMKHIPIYLIITFSLFVVINVTLWNVNFAPFLTTLKRFLPQHHVTIYGLVMTSLLFVSALYFIGSSIVRFWENRKNALYLFSAAAAFFILSTNVKVTHGFTFRYVAQSVPFLVVMLAPYDRLTVAKILRFSFGIGIGMIYLIHHYYIYQYG